MSRRLLIFCGIPGSGKTTIAKFVSGKIGAIHIQTDVVRSMIPSPKYTQDESGFVYRTCLLLAREALKAGHDVIIDGTFLKEDYRREAIKFLSHYVNYSTIVYTKCDVETAYERNASRRVVVPKSSFIRLYSIFEEPDGAIVVDTQKVSPEEGAATIVARVRRKANP